MFEQIHTYKTLKNNLLNCESYPYLIAAVLIKDTATGLYYSYPFTQISQPTDYWYPMEYYINQNSSLLGRDAIRVGDFRAAGSLDMSAVQAEAATAGYELIGCFIIEYLKK